MFIRRSGSGRRFLAWRMGLFWAGVGIWLLGLAFSIGPMTYVAIGLLMVALLLGVWARREPVESSEE